MCVKLNGFPPFISCRISSKTRQSSAKALGASDKESIKLRDSD